MSPRTPTQLHLIAQRLTQPIPAPYRPPPTPSASWQRLKVGDALTLRLDYKLPPPLPTLPLGTRVRVARTYRDRVVLTAAPWDFEWEWNDPLWEQALERERRLSKPRAKKPKRPPIQGVDSTNTQQ